MESLEEIVRERRRVHSLYSDLLSDVPGVVLQYFPSDVDSVLWAIAVKLDPGAYPQGRDGVIQAMKQGQIETRPGFVAPRFMEHIYKCPELPISEDLSVQVLSLPTYPSLRDEQIAHICGQLQNLRS